MAIREKLSITRTQAAPCPCGCAPCEETTCSLDCIVRPRYYCGQLLTDADLTAGVAWSQEKFRLGRRREGWGVACGLEVSCGPQPGLVTIHPGYAVDCCGDDIVVCAETTLDLNALLQQPPKECDPTTGKSRVQVGKTVKGGDWVIVDVSIAYAEENIIPATTLGRAACGQAGQCEFSRTKEGYSLSAVEVGRVPQDQLKKRIDEKQVQAEEALQREVAEREIAAKDAAGKANTAKMAADAADAAVKAAVDDESKKALEAAAAEAYAAADAAAKVADAANQALEAARNALRDSEVNGTSSLRTQDDLLGPNPELTAFQLWANEITACVNGVKALNLQGSRNPIELRNALSGWHAEHPCYQMSYLDGFYTVADNQIEWWVRDNLRHYSRKEVRYDSLVELVFLSMQDCLHHYLARGCAACKNEGVPLARVWLTTTVSQGRAQYTINNISGVPPFHRDLRRESLPAISNGVNLGEVIWRHPYDAAMILARSGVQLNLSGMQPARLDTFQDVYDLFEPGDFLLAAGRSYTPVYYEDRLGFPHVVGVKAAAGQVFPGPIHGVGGLRS